jgi:hypothetical protein
VARRDGYPTNQEMLADFTAASHEVFVNLYEAHMQSNLPPAFEGKPLKNLGIQVTKRYFGEERLPTSVTHEELMISTLEESDVDFMRTQHLKMRELPSDIFDYYDEITCHIAHIALTNTIDLRHAVPQNGIVSHYAAHFPNRSKRHVDTLQEILSKQSIAAAQYFVHEAWQYVASGKSQLHPIERLELAYHYNEEGVINHHFTIIMDAELPLNGYEDTEFLTSYRDRMITYWHKHQQHIEKLITSGMPYDSMDSIQQQVDKLKQAADRAQAILDQRNH